MANIVSPYGFQPFGTVGGSTPNFKQSVKKIASSNATPIYTNDAVSPVISSATGYIQQWLASPGTTVLAGVFIGCKYLSISQGRTVWMPYWPGSDANGDVEAYIIDDPQATFRVQAGSSAIGQANLYQNVQINVGTGNTTTGQSGMFVSSPGTTATFGFQVIGFETDPPGANGTDITTGYNNIYVTFNNEVFRTGNTAIS